MKAALISMGSVSSQWTLEAMQKHFDTVDSVDVRKVEISMEGGKAAELLYAGLPLPEYDCIYAKGSYRYASLLRAVTSFRQARAYMPLADNAFTLVHNKLLTHIVLQQANIPMPVTYLTSTTKAAKKLLDRINFPIVMKFPEGTQGKGVMFADSYASAASLLDALDKLRQPFIIQEYVETGATDIRAIVVGDRVVAAMQRVAVQGEKRANIHAGGVGETVELDAHTRRIAVRAAKALGAEVCGVDILMSIKGPMVIELNISPGLQGIRNATGIDVAEHIAKHLGRRTAEFRQCGQAASKSKIMDDLGFDPCTEKEIVTNLDFRSNRILLPDFVTRLGGFDDSEVVIKVKKNQATIQRN